MFPEFDAHVKCVDDDEPIPPTYKPRGSAGVAILWHKDLSPYIRILPDGGNRLIAIQFPTESSTITLINTYMPTTGSMDTSTTYTAMLDEVISVISKYESSSTVIWTGDINASYQERRCQSQNDKLLKIFCQENRLILAPGMPSTPTYHHFNGSSTSQLDYFLQLEAQRSIFTEISVDSRHPCNASSHDAVTAEISTHFVMKKQPQVVPYNKPKINWEKADMEKYRALTNARLQALMDTLPDPAHPEILLSRTNSILYETSLECDPKATRKKRPKKGYKWDKQLQPYIKNSKLVHWQWKSLGSQPGENMEARKLAKRQLRQAQRQLAASTRNKLHEEITNLSNENDVRMYKVIRKQARKSGTRLAECIIDFNIPAESPDAPDAIRWGQYFEDLATPKWHEVFDKDAKQSATLKYLLLSSIQEQKKEPAPIVSSSKIIECIKRMRNGKAADAYGITSEHIKYASSEINIILQEMTNGIIASGKVPSQMKHGLVTPVLKKGKPATCPDSYRRITVSSNIGKVAERVVLEATKKALSAGQSRHQLGFTEGCSPVHAALLLTESIAEAKDRKAQPIITFMDASKAFDIVCHTGMLNTIYDQGITGQLWCTYNSLYDNITSTVKWNGSLSNVLVEGQGIRQGGLTSTELFKARANPLLHKLGSHPCTFKIGSIPTGSIMVADDLALISESNIGMQMLLNEAESDAAKERYLFSTTKTKAMATRNATGVAVDAGLKLNGQPLAMSMKETHLGIHRADTCDNKDTVQARISSARRAAYALMGAGFHGLNGISPRISSKLMDTYVTPVLLNSTEALLLSHAEINKLEDYYRSTLKRLQHLPNSTATPAVYLLLGALPIQAQIHRKALILLNNILLREGSVEREVVQRQLAVKTEKSNSWTVYVRQLLAKYNLPSAYSLLQGNQTKPAWKKLVKEVISSFWEEELKVEAGYMKTLRYVNLKACGMGKIHPVWDINKSDKATTIKAAIQAKMLVDRYPLYGGTTRKRGTCTTCQLCKAETETMAHFILECPALHQARDDMLSRLQNTVFALQRAGNIVMPTGEDQEIWVKIILDPSHLGVSSPGMAGEIRDHTRNMCFRLHNARSILLTGKPAYAIAGK